MEMRIILEAGHAYATKGMSFSHEQECPLEGVDWVNFEEHGPPKTAEVLSSKDGGHNKFLESCIVWFDIRAPLYFWKQFDTYRIGVTKQSKSTMHTLMRRELTLEDFTERVDIWAIADINDHIEEGDFQWVIENLPSGYLQTRRVCTSYKAIRTMIKQRQNHKLPEWEQFCTYMKDNLEFPELLGGDLVQN